jgi:hypothetical protein
MDVIQITSIELSRPIYSICISSTTFSSYTDKKENQIFLIYKEIRSGAVAKSYIYEEGLPNIRGNVQIFPHI